MEENEVENTDKEVENASKDEELAYDPPVWEDPVLFTLGEERFKVTEEMKQEMLRQEADPMRTSDSKIGHFVQDLMQHPEKSKWYRDHVMFPTIEEKYFPDRANDENPDHWRIEVPIITGTF